MSTTLIAIIVLGLAILVLVIWIVLLERRLGRLLSGKDGANLEETIKESQRAISELDSFRKKAEEEFEKHDARIKKKIDGAKTLRFNPFSGTGSGGNQSFATALIDEDGNGVVLSSLYSREKMSVFAKPIANRSSEFELSDEEKKVLE
jgi:hypothetical protein